jgi:hypothetical protein
VVRSGAPVTGATHEVNPIEEQEWGRNQFSNWRSRLLARQFDFRHSGYSFIVGCCYLRLDLTLMVILYRPGVFSCAKEEKN